METQLKPAMMNDELGQARTSKKEFLDKIESIIAGARYMHLGMFDENYPYVVPLHYGYEMKDGKLTFYVHGAKEGHKLDCLRKNDHVFVEIDCRLEKNIGSARKWQML